MSNLPPDAEAIVVSTADLVGRTGAKAFEIGYLHDDVPMEKAGWYAQAQYRGAKVIEEGAGPVEAADALALRLLQGGQCTACNKPVGIRTPNATWIPYVLAGYCLWRRIGNRWTKGCGA